MASKKPDPEGSTSKSMGEMPKILIALGANIPSALGPPEVTLKAALAALEAKGVKILSLSHFHQTEAWPEPADPPFINAVAAVETQLQPVALLRLLHQVETSFGRKRSAPNAPRSLDLDLLDYGGLIQEGELVLPHPRLSDRRFVLEPLAEVAPDWRHPVTGQSVRDLLAALDRPSANGLAG
jgi:2-amino-4-hydroxy-6-hydroxymethyldihydropteridine diphosphokinase